MEGCSEARAEAEGIVWTPSDRVGLKSSRRREQTLYTKIIPLKCMGLVVKIKLVWIYLLLIVGALVLLGIVAAVRRQAHVTPSYSKEAQDQDARVFAESTRVMEANVAEA